MRTKNRGRHRGGPPGGCQLRVMYDVVWFGGELLSGTHQCTDWGHRAIESSDVPKRAPKRKTPRQPRTRLPNFGYTSRLCLSSLRKGGSMLAKGWASLGSRGTVARRDMNISQLDVFTVCGEAR